MQYKCPKCNTLIEEGVNPCPTCGQLFNWPVKVPTPPVETEPVVENTVIENTDIKETTIEQNTVVSESTIGEETFISQNIIASEPTMGEEAFTAQNVIEETQETAKNQEEAKPKKSKKKIILLLFLLLILFAVVGINLVFDPTGIIKEMRRSNTSYSSPTTTTSSNDSKKTNKNKSNNNSSNTNSTTDNNSFDIQNNNNQDTNNNSSSSFETTVASNNNNGSASNTTTENKALIKQQKIEEENKRHKNAIASIEGQYDANIELKEDTIESLMDDVGVYSLDSRSSYQRRINQLNTQYNNLSARLAYTSSQSERISIQNQMQDINEEIYELNILINCCDMQDQVDDLKFQKQVLIEEENSTHEKNLAEIEQQYS